MIAANRDAIENLRAQWQVQSGESHRLARAAVQAAGLGQDATALVEQATAYLRRADSLRQELYALAGVSLSLAE
jgi:hypothetical protein